MWQTQTDKSFDNWGAHRISRLQQQNQYAFFTFLFLLLLGDLLLFVRYVLIPYALHFDLKVMISLGCLRVRGDLLIRMYNGVMLFPLIYNHQIYKILLVLHIVLAYDAAGLSFALQSCHGRVCWFYEFNLATVAEAGH